MSKLAHVGIVVTDAEHSKVFYQEFCSCKPGKLIEDERYKLQYIDVGGQTLILLQLFVEDTEAPRHCGVVDHLAFQVKEAVKKMRNAGMKLKMDEPRTEIIGANIFYFYGPDGELLEYIH